MANITFPSGKGIFFTSDTHFGHQNILQYSQRPFKSTYEMDEAMITNWNKVVGKDDTVFHLGDFAFGEPKRIQEIVDQLNGKIYLIKGNHDKHTDKLSGIFAGLYIQTTLVIEGQRVLLNHYPLLCYEGTYSGSKPTWQLFGHLHLKPNGTGADFERVKYCFPFQYDVGVDLNNYTPVSWQQVRERILYQIQNKTNVTHWLNEGDNQQPNNGKM